MLNSIGLIDEPWGTPDMIGARSDVESFTFTVNDLFAKKTLVQPTMYLGTPAFCIYLITYSHNEFS